jgi:uncharacterized protein (TIGR03435 family)
MFVKCLEKKIAQAILGHVMRKRDLGKDLFVVAVASMIVAATTVYGQANASQSVSAPTHAQNTTAPRFEYEVVSIKPNKSDGNMSRLMYTPDGLSVIRSSLQAVIANAYQVPLAQLSGAPSWLKSDAYDIEAKMESSAIDELKKLSPDQARVERQHMLQKLLADRCKLAVHSETKELPVYALVVAGNGPKFHEAKAGDTYPNGFKGPDGRSGAGMMHMEAGKITAQAVPLASLTGFLSRQVGRPVIDKTGLTGKYDFTFEWRPDQGATVKAPEGGADAAAAPPEPSGPSIFTALQEQLGLKLESQKGPVEFVVIDHVEKPSEN